MRSARALAWTVWGVCVGLTAVGLAFLLVNGGTHHANSLGSSEFDALLGVLLLTFPTVGAVIATREPRNAIGWLFLGAGVGASLEDSLLGYAAYSLVVAPGSLPGAEVAALLADAVWLPGLAAASLLLFVLFPTGRPMSPRWRWFVWLIAIDLLVFALATLFNPEPLYFYPRHDNPWGVDGAGVLQQAADAAGPVLFSSLLVGVVALAWRFRRSAGVERLQIKSLVYAGGLWLACLPALIWMGGQGDLRFAGARVSDIGDVLFTLLICMIPIAVGVAILRHRLYDIDVVINRTLVYGALTASLLLAYLGSVLVFRLVLSPVAGESDVAVAGSTLAVAALFRPLRSRIQAVVDRRFYRARYDANLTLERFSGRLRDELDLETLGTDLKHVVHDTMAPTHVSLWLREVRS